MNSKSYKMNMSFNKLYCWYHCPEYENEKMSHSHSANLSNDDHFMMPLKYHRFDGIEPDTDSLTWEDFADWEFDDE